MSARQREASATPAVSVIYLVVVVMCGLQGRSNPTFLGITFLPSLIHVLASKLHSCLLFQSIFSAVPEIPNKKHGLYIFMHIQTHSSRSFHSFIRRGHACVFESAVQQKVVAPLRKPIQEHRSEKQTTAFCYYHRPMLAAQCADEPLHPCCHLKKWIQRMHCLSCTTMLNFLFVKVKMLCSRRTSVLCVFQQDQII